ncbi:AAA family ATPase, partial [Colwellia sp. BRX8-2]
LSEQNSDVKKFFEEIAILQAALHLNKFPEKHITDLKGKDLPKVSIEMVFNATIASPFALKCLADYFSTLPYQLKFLPSTLQVRSILDTVVDKRTSQANEQGSKSWYCYAIKKASLLVFDDDVGLCLKHACSNGQIDLINFFDSLLNTEHAAVVGFNKANREPIQTLQVVKASKALKAQLLTKVIGQDSAINSLAKGFLASTLKPSQGPRLIYTFVGPSGVGKTYSASLFAEYLKENEGSDYIFSSYNMEGYADERDAMKLFGSGSQYVDSALGLLTTSVRNYPRQVILFDEIEKAHNTVTTSLLTLLDSGVVNDNTIQVPVDFSQCIIIFTSNLGQETFLKNKTEQSLSVFDVLKTAKNPNTGVGFSPELVNRLSKGYPVIFNSLKMNHLIRLAEKEVASTFNHKGISFNYSPEFSSFLLQSISPDISVRRLQTSIAKFQADVLIDAIEHIKSDVNNVAIDVKIAQALQVKNEEIKVLFLDDDHRVINAEKRFNLASSNTEFEGVEVNHCHQVDELEQSIILFKPDVVLLDLELITTEEKLQSAINLINGCDKQLAIFTYIVDEQTKVSNLIGLNNEVREHFVLSSNNAAIQQLDHLVERIRYYLITERQVRKITQRHQALTYSMEFTHTDEGLALTLNNFNYEQMIFSDDLTNSEFFDFTLPDICLNDVIGLARAKKRLTEVIGWMKQPKKLASMQVELPTGFLFAGPPGTGKTLLAKALAGECQLPFFSVSAADLSSNHVGGTTENIKKLFKTARKYAPAIIFIDEIDAIGRKRTHDSQGESNLVVNTLLTEMDGFNQSDEPVFVLAATNYPEVLDSALTRSGRFDETIICDLPNKKARSQFFEMFIKKHLLQWEIIDVEPLINRTQGMSSAELEQVLRESLYQALSDEEPATVKHVNECITRISYGLPSDKVIMSDEEKKRTAYHETGHLLAYKLLFPNLPVDFITIIPRDQALGFVATGRPDKYNGNTRVTIGYHLQVMLAGRVAEKILQGSSDLVSTGASSDIEKATGMAMSAIFEGGLSDDIGSVNLSVLTKFEESNLLHTAQENVRKWIADSEQEVENLLQENVELFTYFANALLQKESMHKEEINDVIDSFWQLKNVQSC